MMGLKGLGIYNWRSEKLIGEVDLMKEILSRIDRPDLTVIDVGANEGNITEVVLAITSNLSVLAIEPHPITFKRLRSRFEK